MKHQGALLVERIVLESLSRNSKNLQLLSADVGIEENLLKIILQEMLLKGWLRLSGTEYHVQEKSGYNWVQDINREENLEGEVKELMDSMISLHFKPFINKSSSLLKIQKLELTEDEEKLLNSHLKGLEIFFNNIRHSRMKKPLKGQTKKQKVVVWASSFYEDLIGANLVAI